MHTIIIAEAGVNHNGEIELAKQLVEVAAQCGADFVKFQTFKTDKLVSKHVKQADYQSENTGKIESQYDMLKRLELSEEEHYILKEHCKSNNIGFLSTGFDYDSLILLSKLGVDLWKIPSGELTNLPYLRYMAIQPQPLVLSTGMANIHEVEEALKVLLSKGKSKDEITLLHCTTEYPTPYNEVNLNAMIMMGEKFKINYGYSDHTKGIEIPIAAVAMGASLIEKHFTLDNNLPGPDHKASLEPKELKEMVSAIRNVEMALGDGVKQPSISEIKNKIAARKSIHISMDLAANHVIEENDLEMKRPGNGISPMEMDKVIGRSLKQSIALGEMLKWDDLK